MVNMECFVGTKFIEGMVMKPGKMQKLVLYTGVHKTN